MIAALEAWTGLDKPGACGTLSINPNEAIRALIAEVRRNQWQPIETAPKDGTRLLAYMPYPHGPLARKMPPGIVFTAKFTGMRWHTDDHDPFVFFNADPTHWMPLPEPPKETANAE
jgi:hypothetical protein